MSKYPTPQPCPHCGKPLTRYGRADWRCAEHGQMMLELVLIQDTINAALALSSRTTPGMQDGSDAPSTPNPKGDNNE